MQSKSILYSFFVVFLIGVSVSSCGQKETATNTNATSAPLGNAKEVVATYKSCTFYTGSTRYVFETEKGEVIEFTALNDGMEDQHLSAKMPPNMIRNAEDTLAVSDANPKMVGKKFKLIYNQNDEVAEVKEVM